MKHQSNAVFSSDSEIEHEHEHEYVHEYEYETELELETDAACCYELDSDTSSISVARQPRGEEPVEACFPCCLPIPSGVAHHQHQHQHQHQHRHQHRNQHQQENNLYLYQHQRHYPSRYHYQYQYQYQLVSGDQVCWSRSEKTDGEPVRADSTNRRATFRSSSSLKLQPEFARLLTALFVIGICFSSLNSSYAALLPLPHLQSASASASAVLQTQTQAENQTQIAPGPGFTAANVRRRNRLPGNASTSTSAELFTTSLRPAAVNRTAVTLITHALATASSSTAAVAPASARPSALAAASGGAPLLPNFSFSPRQDVRYSYAFENSCSKLHMVANASRLSATGNISQAWFGPYNWQWNRAPSMFPLKLGSRFVCFDQNSRLVMQKTMDEQSCSFLASSLTGNRVLLKLAAKPEWAIGFRKTGEAFLGRSYASRRKTRFRSPAAASTPSRSRSDRDREAREPECFIFKVEVSGKVTSSAAQRAKPSPVSVVFNEEERRRLQGITFVPRRTAAASD